MPLMKDGSEQIGFVDQKFPRLLGNDEASNRSQPMHLKLAGVSDPK